MISRSPPGRPSLPDSGSAAASCTNQRSAGDGHRLREKAGLDENERAREVEKIRSGQ